MNNKIHDAFEPIHATEGLKQNANAFIHSEVVKRRRKSHVPTRYALICCAMLAVMVCGIGGYSFYQIPVSYISVDVNPSVELALNRFDRVTTATAYNDDGALILQNLSLVNKPYTEAVELLLSDKTFSAYLSDGSLLSFTVVSDKEDYLLAGIQQCEGYAQTNAECHSVKADNMEAAHHNGLSFGKYQAYLELAKYDKAITPEHCRDLSMREIRDLTNRYASGEDTAGTQLHSGQGNGGGGNGHGHHGGRNGTDN